MLRLYTFLIIGAIGVTVVFGIFFGFEPTYRSETTYLIVVNEQSVSGSRIVQNMAGVMRMIIAEQDMVDHDVKGQEDTDMLTLTTYGHTVKYVQSLEREIMRVFEERVHKYYGDAVVLHVIQHDRVPQQIIVTQFMPYIIMICVAVGLVAGVLAIFHIFDHMREENEQDMAQLDGKRIFEKFHVATKERDDEDITHDHEEDVYVEEEIKTAKVHEENDDNDEKEVNDAAEDDVEMQGADGAQQGVREVVMPDGLQTIPGNLPIVDVSALGFSKKQQRGRENADEEMIVPAEPTEEELKARLNELLSGKM